MWAVTGWAFVTWVRITVLLGVGVGVVWLVSGVGTGPFVVVCAVAVLAEVYLVRQLHREWTYRARSSWWWSR